MDVLSNFLGAFSANLSKKIYIAILGQKHTHSDKLFWGNSRIQYTW